MQPVFEPTTQVTLVEGSTFCVSGTNGDITPHHSDGLFVQDTRVLSRWQLRVDGAEVEALSHIPAEPFEARFIGRLPTRPGNVEPTLIVERHRMIGTSLREDVTIHNHGLEPAGLDVSLHVEADFADLFEVKEGRISRTLEVDSIADAGGLTLALRDGVDEQWSVRATAKGARTVPGAMIFQVVVPAGGSWQVSLEARPTVAGSELDQSFPLERPLEQAVPAQRMRDWRDRTANFAVDNPVLSMALGTSLRDLGALRIIDPEHPDDNVVAAGAPWFMALFGRDSLLTSAMLMPFAPKLAMGTLRTLARLQGKRESPMSEEQPGKILHEVRLGTDASLALGGEQVYYGSIDSTPLFVILVGKALKWGVPHDELAQLKPAVDAAVDWIERYGDQDGDGFVEYQRGSDRGLLNQGWKDSADSMVHADGTLATGPIALAEVQGYTYAALRAAADLEDALGDDPARAEALRARAAELQRRFHEAFWMPEEDYYALALDGAKQQLRSVTSNIGHCLWSGIIPKQYAGRVVERLVAPDMFSGFGIRTLSSSAARYNPVSYHNGSVWPHDTILGASGIARYGYKDEAMTIATGLVDALEAFRGRLPELFCGFDRADKPSPVPYPTSCSPQAWAAAVPFEILRIGLGLEVDVTRRTYRLETAPALMGRTSLTALPVGERQIDITADEESVRVDGIPDDFRRTNEEV